MKLTQLDTFLYLVEDFLTSSECDDLIYWSEQKGYEEAKVQVSGQEVMLKSVRNNSRITFIDHEMAHRLWERFQPFAPERYGNSQVTGFNEMFRFYKYEPGQRFKRHKDGSYIRNECEVSHFTWMVYLNDDFEGGHTIFDNHDIRPRKGTVLVFEHQLKHAGEELQSGIKYVLRTDIMFKQLL